MTFEPNRFTDLQTDLLPDHCKAGVETSIGINLTVDNGQLSDLNKSLQQTLASYQHHRLFPMSAHHENLCPSSSHITLRLTKIMNKYVCDHSS